MSNFSQLGLSESTLKVLDQLGFVDPTPIQLQAIPLLLENNPTDFIGLAQTGTGKTAAFGLPLIELIDANSNATQALIMAPTRELGKQTAQELVNFSAGNKKLNVEVVYGGAAITNQIHALKKPTQIVVATPGRLLDLIKRKAIKLEAVNYVVLDEADEMLNMGFKEDIDKILSFTHEHRVTWLFSATMPPEIRKIINKYMTDPKEASINRDEISNKDIVHKYVVTKVANKIPALRRFLDLQPDMRGILFCRTRRQTQQIADELGALGYGAEALHGELSQAQRDAVMRRFKNQSMQLLVATDVAARGIDVNDLTHVIHHTLPDQLEAYTHRSGRTGRAGKKGISLAFIGPREGRKIKELEKKVKITFEAIEVPEVEELKSVRVSKWVSDLVNAKISKQAEELFDEIGDQFKELSKEDILKRLITSQLSDLISPKNDRTNLNEKEGDRGEGRDRGNRPDGRDRGDKREKTGEKRERPVKSGVNRYFINIGTRDGVNKSNLVQFLSEVSGVKRKAFDDVSVQTNCAYFDVASTQEKGFGEKFRGIEIEGREVRVNRDEERGGKEKQSKPYSGDKSFKSKHKKKPHHKSHGSKKKR